MPLFDETLANYGPRSSRVIAVESSGIAVTGEGDQVDMEGVEEMEEPDTEPESGDESTDLSDVDGRSDFPFDLNSPLAEIASMFPRMADIPLEPASTAPEQLSDAFPVCSLNNFALATDETQLLECKQSYDTRNYNGRSFIDAMFQILKKLPVPISTSTPNPSQY